VNLEQRIRPQPKGLGSVNSRMSCPREELPKVFRPPTLVQKNHTPMFFSYLVVTVVRGR